MMQSLINKINTKRLVTKILIIMSFLILSIFSIAFIWYRNKLYFTGDAPFHIQRLGELLKSNSLFPTYALNSFDSVGSAVMSMYPYVFLYLMALIFHICGSITYTLYITYIIGTFVSLMISFFSSLSISKNYLISYLFSLIYSLSYEFIAMYFSSNIIGVYWSSIFLPLVIFGLISFFKDSKWVMLSCGMTLVLYNSIITFLFVAAILFMWIFINYKLFNKIKICSLIKAVALTIITTSLVWIPVIKLSILNKLFLPSTKEIAYMNPFQLIKYSILPKPTIPTLTIYSMLGLIFGYFLYSKSSYLLKQAYLISIFIILLSSILPWQLLSGNFILFKLIRKIQFTWRLLIFPQVILEFILSVCIVHFFSNNLKSVKGILIVLSVLFIVCFQFMGQIISLHVYGTNLAINNSRLMQDNSVQEDYKDYFPMSSVKYMKNLHNHVSNSKGRKIKFLPRKNGRFVFYNKKYSKRIVVPFLYYNGTKYMIYLNSRRVPVKHTSNQLIVLNNVKQGKHYLNISIPVGEIVIIARLLSLFGIMIYGYILIKRKILELKM